MKKKYNPLSLNTYPLRKRAYIIHPLRLVKTMYRNIRNFIYRGRYGYCPLDAWNFCEWFPRVGAEALHYLALHNEGYPAVEPWNTPKDWDDYLLYMSQRLKRCADSQDIEFGEDRNEYASQFDTIMRNHRVHTEEGTKITKLTPEEDEIRKKYFEREKEIHDADVAYDIETFKWLAEDIRRIWS